MKFLRQFEKPLRSFLLKSFKLWVTQKDFKPEEIDHKSIKNILIVHRHRMGDMICAVPMFRSVRNFYPDAKLILVTNKASNSTQIYQSDPSLFNEIIKYENGFESLVNVIKMIRDFEIDLAIIPSTVICSVTNHIIAYFSNARIRVGTAGMDDIENEADFLLNVKKYFSWQRKKVHQIERNLDIIRQINVYPLEKKIKITTETNDFVNNFILENFPDKNRIIVGIHPGAGKRDNVWSPEKFAEISYRLYTDYNAYIFISESRDDAEFVNEMVNILKEKYGMQNLARHNGLLMNNAALISLMSVFITNDTGIMHLASGIDKLPVIALFGPTNAYEWGPIGENKISIQSSSKNIDEIPVEQVYAEVIKFLK